MIKFKYISSSGNRNKPIIAIITSLLKLLHLCNLQLLLLLLLLLSLLLLESQHEPVKAAAFLFNLPQRPTTCGGSIASTKSSATAITTPRVCIRAPHCRYSTHYYTRLYSSSSSSSSSSRNDDKDDKNRQQTLYEILNSSPTASRSELKKAYVNLVKQLHPDAIGSSSAYNTDLQQQSFQTITQAWKTLSNPLERKRYDRDLRAQKFTQDIEQAMGNLANTAGPQFLNAFENVAIPFLRRSAATTFAGLNAVVQDVQMYSERKQQRERENRERDPKQTQGQGQGQGLGSILSNALLATQKAGKAIDRLELIEKSRELSKRAQKEMKEAMKLREELEDIAQKRMQLTLHTPKSNLTSLEASIILDGFNIVDQVTMMDTVLLRKSVGYEIEKLQEMEIEFDEKTRQYQQIISKLQSEKSSLHQAKINASAALKAVENARKALQDVMDLAQSAKEEILTIEGSLKSSEELERIQSLDIERLKDAMMRQQERMRLALRRKEEQQLARGSASSSTIASTVTTTSTSSTTSSIGSDFNNNNNNNNNGNDVNNNKNNSININNMKGDFKNDLAEYAQAQVEKMLQRESFLRAESARLQAQAERLESRSQKLLERANELEEEEEQAYKALEEGIRVAQQATKGGYAAAGGEDDNAVIER